MQHIITDEEVKTALQTYFRKTGGLGAMEKALTDFLNNLPEAVLCPQWIHDALNAASAPTHHPIKSGAKLAKPMTPQERIAWLANRPQVAQLRPITEMPETVPEGCVRWFCYQYGSGELGEPGTERDKNDNLFIDVLQLPTPDPDAEERRQFEEAMKKKFPEWSFERYKTERGDYKNIHCESSWIGFKIRAELAKKGGDK